MPEPTFSLAADDDLPRTVRRERDAREREARERAAAAQSSSSVPAIARDAGYDEAAPAATVTDFDVPLSRLMIFFIKAVFAAIPALLILTAMLWVFGQALQFFFPQLLQLKILIYMP